MRHNKLRTIIGGVREAKKGARDVKVEPFDSSN